jgi:hypothetical protein
MLEKITIAGFEPPTRTCSVRVSEPPGPLHHGSAIAQVFPIIYKYQSHQSQFSTHKSASGIGTSKMFDNVTIVTDRDRQLSQLTSNYYALTV